MSAEFPARFARVDLLAMTLAGAPSLAAVQAADPAPNYPNRPVRLVGDRYTRGRFEMRGVKAIVRQSADCLPRRRSEFLEHVHGA